MKAGIKFKLILSLILTNSLLAILIFWLSSQSFDRGFLAYLNKAETQKLQPLVDDLSKYYQTYSGWDWVHEQHFLWRELMQTHIRGKVDQAPRRLDRERRGEGRRHDAERRVRPIRGERYQQDSRPHRQRPPPPQSQQMRQILNIDPRLLLRTKDEQLIIGNPNDIESAQWIAIKVNNVLVGELGVKSLNSLSSQIDVLFAEQQKESFLYIVGAFLLSAIVLAILLANHFLGPLRIMKQGLNKLVSGDYDTKLTLHRKDELGQLATDFNLLSLTLKENQQSRQQWIADISHELRTPVSILQAELDALIEGVRTVDRDALVSLQQESRRLGNLINDLHELSLSDLGALSYTKKPINVAEFLNEFLDENSQRIEEHGLKVDFNVSLNCKHRVILADGDRLEQCFKNLLQNTYRYTDTPGTLKIALECDKQSISILWEDSSPGVNDGDLKELFERLYRVEKSRNREKGGAGLGLSICKNIIQAHTGSVRAFHSSLGGLGIRISFPVNESNKKL